ncbi:hypothetical protein [uncultured Sunxiuqinia sp.]|uniref:hypothetical protein n=1 Tax=uncultured Sunxiuqinia sp. TaxID=1573825 RepID=UPI0030DC924B|tara:strand:- start:1494 stop:1715 length:222 start_codon:yes stop_codon:yes gene_type:complete
MDQQVLVENTIVKIKQLPESKLMQVNDFVAFLLSRAEDKIMLEGIQKLASDSTAFEFLKEEDDLYTMNDLKEK